jgi:uncharacterized RDD family membrane protein YckC
MTSGGFDPQPGPLDGPYSTHAEPGGLLARFLARLIDGIIVGVVGGILLFAVGMQSHILVTGVFTGVLMFIYFVAFEVTQGWTPGKKLLGLHVQGPAGAPKPDLSQSAIRNAFTLLPVVPFVGGLLAFIAIVVIAVTINGSPTKQGTHDELAGGTQVLKG